jgi:2,4-dienoyl-CoA reductase-like NADH-dependent reductase (Old Yellow Enzyme family)
MDELVFQESKLGEVILKNKIIRAATHEGMADEFGCPTEKMVRLYEKIAKGEPGAIITGSSGTQPNGRSALHGQSMIHDDSFIESYKKITDTVHKYDIPIFIQIAHAGRQTRYALINQRPVAPTALKDWYYSEVSPRALTEDEIENVIDNFVNAVERAHKAGFDGVQIHAAHGYLLSEFLSGYTNRRQDKWGGSIENRYRIISEIIKRSRNRVPNFPLLVKINGHDSRKNGMRVQEACQIARMLEFDGAAAIEVSCGVIEEGFNITRGAKLPFEAILNYSYKYKKKSKFSKFLLPYIAPFLTKKYKQIYNYNVDAAHAIKESVSIPVIVVGGIKNLSDIESIILNKKADYVAMSRAFITEPSIVKRFKAGRQNEAKCITCNYCTIIQDERALKCYYGRLPKIQITG